MNDSPLFTFFSYLKYSTKAVGAHSLHSPFVFKVFNKIIKKSQHFRIADIEKVRKKLRNNHEIIDVIDFKNRISRKKTISSIAKTSLSKSKFSAFLHLLVNELAARTVLETGTSLGVNSLYLAWTSATRVITIEASPILCQLAKNEFEKSSQQKILIESGDVNERFSSTLIRHQPDFIFLDADHRGSTIRNQVDQILELSKPVKCIVIHDIYWSQDMNQAWKELVRDQRFTLSIDIFQAGILFPSKGMEKQHFTLRF